ncbi:MAG: signal peptidase II [Candidatus Zixiibacteriota bacterium]
MAADSRNLRWPAVIVFLVVLLDQLTKLWAVSALTGQPSQPFLGRFFMFTLIYNEGGAMGTSFGSSTFYLIVSLVVTPILTYFIYTHREQPILALPMSFIVGGAIGNIIDRIRFGQVVDFIDIDIPDINLLWIQIDRWWTFNIADASISCSLAFLIVYLTFFKHKHSAPLSTDTPQSRPVDTH